MKKKDRSAYHAMSREELIKQESSTREKLTEVYSGKDAKQRKNVREGFLLRKKIAQLATIRREKELVHES